MKRLLLLLSLCTSAYGAANIACQTGTIVVSADGRTVSCTLTGGTGPYSPSSGVTNIQVYSQYRGGYITTSGTGVTVAGGTTLNAVIPSNQPPLTKNETSVALLVVATGSNLTDSASNTVVVNNYNVNMSGTEWYLPTIAPFVGASMAEGSYIANAGEEKGSLTFVSSGTCLSFNANVTGINLRTFQYGAGVGHHWVLYNSDAGNPGTLVNDFGTTTSVTSSIDLTPVNGLSGMHLYRLCDVSSQANNMVANAVRLTGLSAFGSAPTRRPIFWFLGDSLRANELVPDLRLGDGWPLANMFNAVYIHAGASGNKISTEVLAAANTILGQLSGSDTLSVLNCCWSGGLNDIQAGATTTQLATSWTNLLNAITASGKPIGHVLTLGLAPTAPYSSAPGTYDPSVRTAILANSLVSTYVHTSSPAVTNWTNNTDGDGSCTMGGGDKQAVDHLHLQGCDMSTLVGYGKVVAREVPLYDGFLNGSSYHTSCPGTATVGTPITCTVTKFNNAPWVGDENFTPSSSGGTFSPSGTITPTIGTTAPTFTFTATSSGSKTINYASGQEGWVNPSASTVVASSGVTPQSVQTGTSTIGNLSIPITDTNRFEFGMDNWTPPVGTEHVIYGYAGGWYGQMSSASILQLSNQWDTQTVGVVSIDLSALTPKHVKFRLQHDVPNMKEIYEAFDAAENRILYQEIPFSAYNSSTPGNTIQFGSGVSPETSRFISFARMDSTLVPPLSKPPSDSDVSATQVFNWRFNGDLLDSSTGHAARNATVIFGSSNYATTTSAGTTAIITTVGHPEWIRTIPQRAGYGMTLSCLDSTDQGTNGNAPTGCAWQQIAGPSKLVWDSQTSMTPKPVGNIFGDYTIGLTTTNLDGSTSYTTSHVGSVAQDDKGVVVQANNLLDNLYGYMIALGKSPWHYSDQWHLDAMTTRAGADGLSGNYKEQGWVTGPLNKPMWEYTGQGTVSYYWNGVGIITGHHTGSNPVGTTLAANFTSTDTSITVTDITKLDMTVLPTILVVTTDGDGAHEEHLRVGCTAPTGNVIPICYQGRDEDCANNVGCFVRSTDWPSTSTKVAQFKLVGTGTKFFTDPNAPICPLGKGRPGPSYYSTGTLSVARGSTTIIGTGTTWTTAMRPPDPAVPQAGGMFIQAMGLKSGVQFVFSVRIVGFTDATHMTIARPFPSDADADLTNVSYNIMAATRSVDARYQTLIDSTGISQALWPTRWCESETAAFMGALVQGPSLTSGHDNGADGVLESGMTYSVADQGGYVNQGAFGGISFYGEGGASKSLHARSGLTSAKNAATMMNKWWPVSPFGNPEVAGGSPLFPGGQALFSIIEAIVSNGVDVPWQTARGFAKNGINIITQMQASCNAYDSRDSGYPYAHLILMALYDPDATFKSTWVTALANMEATDAACKRSDNSWASQAYHFSADYGPLVMTSGDANFTLPDGQGPGLCTGIATGTGTVTAGSSTLTITGTTRGTLGTGDAITTGIVVNRTDGSITQNYFYSGSGASVLMSSQWPGTTGNVTWMTYNGTLPQVVIGKNVDSPSLANPYQCIQTTDSTHFALDRNFIGTSGSDYYGFNSGRKSLPVGGLFQQPFMLTIKGYGMNKLATSSLAPYNTDYAATGTGYTKLAMDWTKANAIDPNNLGMNYARVNPWCEPMTVLTNITFKSRQPGCNDGLDPQYSTPARQLSAEITNMLGAIYSNDPTTPNKTFGDTTFGSIWGKLGQTEPGAYVDQYSVGNNLGRSNLIPSWYSQGKYYGQVAGMGFLSNWSAVRLGGVDAPDNQNFSVPFSLSSFSGAHHIVVKAIFPSGNPVLTTCTVSPCAYTLDARQGDGLVTLEYQTVGNTTISVSDPFVVRLRH